MVQVVGMGYCCICYVPRNRDFFMVSVGQVASWGTSVSLSISLLARTPVQNGAVKNWNHTVGGCIGIDCMEGVRQQI